MLGSQSDRYPHQASTRYREWKITARQLCNKLAEESRVSTEVQELQVGQEVGT